MKKCARCATHFVIHLVTQAIDTATNRLNANWSHTDIHSIGLFIRSRDVRAFPCVQSRRENVQRLRQGAKGNRQGTQGSHQGTPGSRQGVQRCREYSQGLGEYVQRWRQGVQGRRENTQRREQTANRLRQCRTSPRRSVWNTETTAPVRVRQRHLR